MAPGILPTPEEERKLHQRLMAGDPVAPADLASVFLTHLIDRVQCANSTLDRELCADAAEDAIVSLIKNPGSYKPERKKGLFAYLAMSAQGDLKNRLRSKHSQFPAHISLDTLELSPDGGKYLGREDDPSLRMQKSEELEHVEQTVLASIRKGLPDEELAGLELLLHGEWRTAVFAPVLRLDHLPKDEQEAGVKRFKDKMKSRIKRGRDTHE